MALPRAKTSITVDGEAAEILNQAIDSARAEGQTLGAFLRDRLRLDPPLGAVDRQLVAWRSFVEEANRWANANLPPGLVVDVGRDAMYDERD